MSINYIEKGAGLHAAIEAAGLMLMNIGGVWVSSDDNAVQAIIDSYDALTPMKAELHEKVQIERDRRKSLGYLVGGTRFHSDRDSRIQQLGLVMMGANMPAGIMWKTLSGGFVEMTPTLALQIFNATATADMTLHAVGEGKRAAIAAMTDYAALLAYDVTAGWPEL